MPFNFNDPVIVGERIKNHNDYRGVWMRIIHTFANSHGKKWGLLEAKRFYDQNFPVDTAVSPEDFAGFLDQWAAYLPKESQTNHVV